MKFNDLVNLLKDKGMVIENSNSDILINNISYDSRNIEDNTIFVCKGLNFKSEYLESAIKKGAVGYVSCKKYDVDVPYIIVNDELEAMGILAKAIYDIPDRDLIKVGITGTKGKTTIAGFIHNILDEETNSNNAYWSTIDHYTGKTYGESHNTTPEVVDIYKMIKDAKESSIKYLTMEVSSQAYKLKRIYNVSFDIGAFINISYDHVSPLEHKDFNEYLACKLGFLKQCKVVFLYRGIDNYDYILNELKNQKVYTFGDSPDCDFIYSDIEKKGNGTYFKVKHNNKVREYAITIAGDFNCINATCAIAIATYLNISHKSILKGLEKTKVIGRMNIYNGKCPIIVDYAHNKISVEALMRAIKKDYPNRNIRLVFGCPGDRGINRRCDVGTLAGIYASYIYLTAEDPQTKKIEDICDEIITYISPYNKPFKVIPDRETAIKCAYQDARDNDIIAIIGKGDETYQIVNGEYVFYKSDIKVVEEILSEALENI